MSQFKLGDYFAKEFIGASRKTVIDNLEGVCYDKTEGEYTKTLTQDELAEKKDQLADISIRKARLEDERKELMAEMKEKMKEPKEIHSDLIETLKFKSERRDGVLYLIDDQEDEIMYSFDELGTCVDMRPLKPSEKQSRIKMLNRKAE